MGKALVVGINNYPTSPLSGCINDMERFSTVIEFNGNGSPNFDVKKVPDIATSAELQEQVEELFGGNDDIALFYFSGHGYFGTGGGFLVTPDYSKYNMGYRMDDLIKVANSSSCKNRIIFLDCCTSGALGEDVTSTTNSSELAEGVTILTASRKNEAAVERHGAGVFTDLLVAALQGGAADFLGNVTPAGIYSYIDRMLNSWAQRPVFKTNITGFVPLRKTAPQVPVETIRLLTEYFPHPEQEFKLDPSFEYTNTKEVPHEYIKPYADPINVQKFKNLQKLQSIGFVVPIGEDYMYYAAMNSKSCKLTAVGNYYWELVKNHRI